MKMERPRYTEFPQPGENYLVSAARVSTWIMAQATPEQFREMMEESTGKTLPDDARVELSPNWAERAIIPLIDNSWGILAGVRLNHRAIQEGKESFIWQSEGRTFTITIAEERKNLILELSNPSYSFLRRTSSLEIFVTNVYQEAEHGISRKFCPTDSNVFLIPIPVLVEGIPSVLMWITKSMKSFIEKTYPPKGFSLRKDIEGILEKKGF